METISAAVPRGRPLNNACESSGSQWPEAHQLLLLPLTAYPVRVTGQHVACWPALRTAQNHLSPKHRRRTKATIQEPIDKKSMELFYLFSFVFAVIHLYLVCVCRSLF